MDKMLTILLFLILCSCEQEGPFIYESDVLETFEILSANVKNKTSTFVYNSVLTEEGDVIVLTGFPDIEMISFNNQLEYQWEKICESVGNNRPSKMIDVGDGLVVVGDVFNEQNFTVDLLIFKTDYEGTIIFEYIETFPFALKGISILQNAAGDLIYIASRNNTATIFDYDIIIGKLSADGDPLWTERDNFGINNKPIDILERPDGGFLILNELELGPVQFKLHAFDSEGIFESEILLDVPPAANTSFISIGHFYNLINSADGGYLFTYHQPEFTGEPLFNTTAIKLDADLNVTWEIELANIGAEGMTQTNDGNFIVYGSTTQNGDIDSIYLVKIDQNGSVIWERQFNDFPNQTHAKSVHENNDGSLIIFGDRSSNFILMKLDSEGKPM